MSYIRWFLTFFTLISLQSAVNAQVVFTSSEQSTYRDIIISNNKIWTLKSYCNPNCFVTVRQTDLENNLIWETEPISNSYELELRWERSLLSVDPNEHVYLFVADRGTDNTDDAIIYKIDQYGQVIWKSRLPSSLTTMDISTGAIDPANNELIITGFEQEQNESWSESLYASIDIESGEVKAISTSDNRGFKGYTDLARTDDKTFVLELVLNEDDLYQSSIIELASDGTINNIHALPLSDFLGTTLTQVTMDTWLVGGYIDGIAHLLMYDRVSEEIVWDQIVYDAFDDFDIDVHIYQGNIVVSMTTFPRGNNGVPGSGIEGLVGLFEMDGNLLHYYFLDGQDVDENFIFKSQIDGSRLYFCGFKVAVPFFKNPQFPVLGYYELDQLVSTHDHITISHKGLITPNPSLAGQPLRISAEPKGFLRIIDFQGKTVFHGMANNVINVALDPGYYTILLTQDQKIYVDKLIIL